MADGRKIKRRNKSCGANPVVYGKHKRSFPIFFYGPGGLYLPRNNTESGEYVGETKKSLECKQRHGCACYSGCFCVYRIFGSLRKADYLRLDEYHRSNPILGTFPPQHFYHITHLSGNPSWLGMDIRKVQFLLGV